MYCFCMCCVVAIWWLFAVGLFDYIFIQGILPGNHYDETRTTILPINGCNLRWNRMTGLRWNIGVVAEVVGYRRWLTCLWIWMSWRIFWGYMELESIVPVQRCISTLLGHINDDHTVIFVVQRAILQLSTFGSPMTVGLILINGTLGSISRRRS